MSQAFSALQLGQYAIDYLFPVLASFAVFAVLLLARSAGRLGRRGQRMATAGWLLFLFLAPFCARYVHTLIAADGPAHPFAPGTILLGACANLAAGGLGIAGAWRYCKAKGLLPRA